VGERKRGREREGRSRAGQGHFHAIYSEGTTNARECVNRNETGQIKSFSRRR